MELIQKYIYQVYLDKSFSTAAKTLYVTQPALSAAIGRFEKEMGIKIFDRSKKPLSLTQQGIIYIETLEEIIHAENNMQRRFRELSDMSYGSISVGGSSSASYTLMAKATAAFNKKYPKIKVLLNPGNVGKADILSESLLKGSLDLMFTYKKTTDKFVYEKITEDTLIIAMHKDLIKNKDILPYALNFDELRAHNTDKLISDYSLFNDVSFIPYEHHSPITQIMKEISTTYKNSPCAIKNARHAELHYKLMREGAGAALISDLSVLHSYSADENILYFIPESNDFKRKIYLARTPLADHNPIIMNYINTVKELFPQGK